MTAEKSHIMILSFVKEVPLTKLKIIIKAIWDSPDSYVILDRRGRKCVCSVIGLFAGQISQVGIYHAFGSNK